MKQCACLLESPDSAAVICQLAQQIPEPYNVNLRYVMSHLCRVACHSSSLGKWDGPQRINEVFRHTLLRPPWVRIM